VEDRDLVASVKRRLVDSLQKRLERRLADALRKLRRNASDVLGA
jgi:hypothetical protein